MRKILPILLALIGLGGGVGAGIFLRPPPEEAVVINPCGDGTAPSEHADAAAAEGHGDAAAAEGGHGEGDGAAAEPTREYVKLNNQFVVPVVEQGQVAALVILSLSLEVKIGATQKVYTLEPKLRDNFLQVLFDHANSGGFRGAFTEASNLDPLRRALLEVAIKAVGPEVTNVLISDIVRQDAA
ncbi:flagellar basal body-associated FliL family protein [Phaeovulum sp. W22_SRMD_FR3]|uniref:flagellar basal body-associated FliL family protein n=1 Tax=Phaeovulum sp. W22_SRMD_FR3 TaxID=3240274 RepID=UPI003F977E35